MSTARKLYLRARARQLRIRIVRSPVPNPCRSWHQPRARRSGCGPRAAAHACVARSSSLILICCSAAAFSYIVCTDATRCSARSSDSRTAARTAACTAAGCDAASAANSSMRD
eukprot:1437958-Prymnesium_polylepis.1